MLSQRGDLPCFDGARPPHPSGTQRRQNNHNFFGIMLMIIRIIRISRIIRTIDNFTNPLTIVRQKTVFILNMIRLWSQKGSQRGSTIVCDHFDCVFYIYSLVSFLRLRKCDYWQNGQIIKQINVSHNTLVAFYAKIMIMMVIFILIHMIILLIILLILVIDKMIKVITLRN